MISNNFSIKRMKIPKIYENISNVTILKKLNSLDKKQNEIPTDNQIKKNNKYKNNKKKYNSSENDNSNNLTYNQLYIPKDNILKILVKYYNKSEINKTQNIIAPLRTKICTFQEKHDKISKEIEEIDKETKPFINRYKLSGLLTPKNNSQFLKLGVAQKTINEFNYLGFKMNDIINKTNIFDQSLLLNKQYDNFVKYVTVSKDSELVNDSNYISKINDGLVAKKNSELFEINKIYDKKIKIKENGNDNQKDIKISRIQLSNTFNDINKTLKMINDKNFLKGNKIKNIKNINKKENIKNLKNEIINANKSINELEKEKNKEDNLFDFKKELNLINIYNNNIKNKNELNIDNNLFKKSINCLTPNNETSSSFLYNKSFLSTSFPEKTNYHNNRQNNLTTFPKNNNNKDIFENEIYNQNNNYTSFSSSLKNVNKNNTKENNNVNKLLRNTLKYNIKSNNNILKLYPIIKNQNKNYENNKPKNTVLIDNKSEKRKSKIEEYNNIKHNLLQRLYKNIKMKTFSENKKEISDYLKTYKGTNIKEPNFEKGSKLYNLINDFLKISSDYNLPYEINKIRSKTNIFDYKKNFHFNEIKKLNNRIYNLIYDCAEDILDLNNDIKK